MHVQILLNTTADAELIKLYEPDTVIIATGSRPFIPPIQGADQDFVVAAHDVLLGKTEPGNRVVVIGGGLVGAETADMLGQQCEQVTIIEMLPADYERWRSSSNKIHESQLFETEFRFILLQNFWKSDNYKMRILTTLFTPLICLAALVPLTIVVIGPLIQWLSNGVAAGYNLLYQMAPPIAGAVVVGVWQVIVIFGIHWGMVPIVIANFAQNGQDTLQIFIQIAVNFTDGSCIWSIFKSKRQAAENRCTVRRNHRNFRNYRTGNSMGSHCRERNRLFMAVSGLQSEVQSLRYWEQHSMCMQDFRD